MTDEWIEQDGVEGYSALEGIDGKIIITTSQATILKIDGERSIEQILVDAGYRSIVDQLNAGNAKFFSPSGKEFTPDYVPTANDQVIITNVTKAA